jgi:hypothetical protein
MNWILISKWLKNILLSLMIFIAPIKPLLVVVGLVIVLDTIFGIIRSRKLGIKFTSRRFFSFFKKNLIYQLAVISTYILDTYLFNEFTLLIISIDLLSTKIMASAICFNEIKSIDENLKIAYGVGLLDYLKRFFRFAKKAKEGLDELKP